jgi:predicted site-specific integrase-resolvase
MKNEKTYGNNAVAKMIGIDRATLYRWLATGKLRATHEMPMGDGAILRRWTDADVKKLREFKEKNYRVKTK